MDIGLIASISGIALVAALSGAGSSIGVGIAGQAAAGVLSEEPEKFGTMIPFVSLPGTQGFYGLLLGFLVIMKLDLLKETAKIPSASVGLQILGVCLFLSVVEAVSAIYQGKVAAASIGMVAKNPKEVGKALILPVFVEIYAVLGLVIGFLLLQAIKL
jgi:V/A-type H+-transporting ATPase subunit K